jgi:hypothetical protein
LRFVAGARSEQAQHQDDNESDGGGEKCFQRIHNGIFLLVKIVFLLDYTIIYAAQEGRIVGFGTISFEFETKGECPGVVVASR